MPSHTHKAAYLSLMLGIAMASTSLSAVAVHAADISNGESKGDKEEIVDPSRIGAVKRALHDWNVIVGGGAVYQPKFEGSSEYEVSAIPFVSATLYDRITIDPSGVSVKAYNQGPFRLDIKAGYEGGRDESDSKRLRGLGDVDAGVSVGGRATYNLGPAEVFISLEQTLGGSEGLLATAGVSAQRPVSERLILGAEGAVTYADDNYMEAFFGVNARQAARSGLTQFAPEAGIKSVELSLSATYLISENWFLKAKETVGFLTGDAADSPIVEEDVQSKSLLLLGYRF